MGKMGVQLHDYANGLDTDPVRSRYEPEMVKSVGNGTTFPKNLTTAEQVRALPAGGLRGHPTAAQRAVCRRRPGDGAGSPVP